LISELAAFDEIGDERRVEKDLDRRLQFAIAVAHEALADDRAQADRQVGQHRRGRRMGTG
jgi:hypothetical protein